MAAYLVVELAITDPVAFARYRELVPPTVAAYDGHYLVRGGAITSLEGDWHPERVTIIAFPSAERARAWWDPTEYAEAKAIRQVATVTRMVIVEGVRARRVPLLGTRPARTAVFRVAVATVRPFGIGGRRAAAWNVRKDPSWQSESAYA